MASKVGPMTNSERNSASPTSTWFGGTDWVPIALRTSDSTTTIFVNAVHMSRIAGATPSTVMSAMIETTWLGCPGTLTDTDGCFGAPGPVGFAGAFGPDAAGAATAAGDEDAEPPGVAAVAVEAATGSVAAAITTPAARRSPMRRAARPGVFTGA